MSAWSGDLTMGTEENPLNTHMDFQNLTVKIPGGAEKLIGHRTNETEVKNLKIYDPEKSDNISLGVTPYATSGPCGYIKADGTACADDAIYVNSEAEMISWFNNYNDLAGSSRLKCLKVTVPFSTAITKQLAEGHYLQSKHYDFGGATISHSLKYLLPRTEGTSPTIANLMVRITGTGVQAGVIQELRGGTVENCMVIVSGTANFNDGRFGGIARMTYPSTTVKKCTFIVENGASATFNGTIQGGIVGYSHGVITSCRAEFPDGATIAANANIWGGLTGFMSQSSRINDSSAYVTIDSYNSNNVSTGGLVGEIGNGGQGSWSIIEGSYSEGSLVTGYRNIGGVIGMISIGPSIRSTKSFVSRVATLFNYSGSNTPYVSLGGFVGYIAGNAVDFSSCMAFTNFSSDASTYKSDAAVLYSSGFVGYIASGRSVNFDDCYVYVAATVYACSNNRPAVYVGGFIGETGGSTDVRVSNPQIYVRNYSNLGGATIINFGLFLGKMTDYPPTLSNNSSTKIYRTSGMWVVGNHVDWFSDRPTTNTWPSSQPFGSGGNNPSNSETTLNGSSIGSSGNDRVTTLVFNGLGTSYSIVSLYISVNYLDGTKLGTYTQLIYNGKLLGNINATNYVGGTGTVLKVGDTVPVRDKFIFKYTTPASNTVVNVKFTIKNASGNKRSFILYGNGSIWSELPYTV